MKLKLKIDDEFRTQIEQNDRGNWRCVSTDESSAVVFQGFGGENELTIHQMGMQDGTVDFLVVHSQVDSFIRHAHGTVHVSFMRGMEDSYTKRVNELLAQVIDYPDEPHY